MYFCYLIQPTFRLRHMFYQFKKRSISCDTWSKISIFRLRQKADQVEQNFIDHYYQSAQHTKNNMHWKCLQTCCKQFLNIVFLLNRNRQKVAIWYGIDSNEVLYSKLLRKEIVQNRFDTRKITSQDLKLNRYTNKTSEYGLKRLSEYLNNNYYRWICFLY